MPGFPITAEYGRGIKRMLVNTVKQSILFDKPGDAAAMQHIVLVMHVYAPDAHAVCYGKYLSLDTRTAIQW